MVHSLNGSHWISFTNEGFLLEPWVKLHKVCSILRHLAWKVSQSNQTWRGGKKDNHPTVWKAAWIWPERSWWKPCGSCWMLGSGWYSQLSLSFQLALGSEKSVCFHISRAAVGPLSKLVSTLSVPQKTFLPMLWISLYFNKKKMCFLLLAFLWTPLMWDR